MKNCYLSFFRIISVTCVIKILLANEVYAQCSPCTAAANLQNCLNNTLAGQTLQVSGLINLDDPGVVLPIVIPAGVTLEGDYDPIGNPGGTLIFSDTHRSQYDIQHSPGLSNMYLFVMEPGGTANSPAYPTVIKGINLRGSNKVATGNDNGFGIGTDDLYCGGILLFDPHACYL